MTDDGRRKRNHYPVPSTKYPVPLKHCSMKKLVFQLSVIFILLLAACNSTWISYKPLSVHPDNPHYFLFRGKPCILIGSTEHYGAVLNLDFDYRTYLDELAAMDLNITRTFSGIYVEPSGAFNIKMNTLAPAYGRFICPWARSTESGYANGGNKFDIKKWDDGYFTRLKDFVTEAGKRNIVVELDLFSNFYDTIQWKLSPLYLSNNVNSMSEIKDHKEVLSLKHPELLEVQEKMVRKVVNELKDFDNLYYEICNEPYFGDTTALRQWEKHMTGVVIDAEAGFKNKHLISNNIANNYRFVAEPREGVSIYNFHYARPPVAVKMNYHLNLPLGDNETGFDGIGGAVYRKEAWNFILAGGALFNNLDYSFTAENEDGSYIVKEGQPGGGSRELREQFRILARLMKSVDYISMKPVNSDILRIKETEKININGLAGETGSIILYISTTDTIAAVKAFEINLTAGAWEASWINTRTGEKSASVIKCSAPEWVSITTPVFIDDIALTISRKSEN